MKIICVGLNYARHIEEFNSQVPEEPVVFFKPDSAILRDNKPFYIPDFTQQLDYETELVVRIGRLGKNISEKFAHRYYDSVALGIDLTARDLQRKARSAGHPWALSKGFDGAAVLRHNSAAVSNREDDGVNELREPSQKRRVHKTKEKRVQDKNACHDKNR